jgi:hypothetical protein
MITKFNIFNEGSASNGSGLTYDEAIDLYKLDSIIKDYFTEKYPNEDIKILGRYGYTMGVSVLGNLIKFAKKHYDMDLVDLINKHLSYIKTYTDDPEAYRAAKKYNL